ncbi:hypothetical protein [Lichenibacterium dinghuense]|uniref:hypothetical protein n=1 Tax=Lichenibacterium dinghuense TaxID=2895977 RepID=UPI001F464A54|nr:hypothetical protein [Lichenibacterium sp. 6Y81]
MTRNGARIAALCAVAVAGIVGGGAARADDAREAQLIGFHQLCDHGDRGACVKFGMLLQQNRDRHDEWRRSHPEFFFFER